MFAKRLPLIVTFSAPSGTGKDSVLHGVLEHDPHFTRFVAATTRAPRMGDVHGVTYHFLTREDFKARLEAGEILEYNEHYGNFYGTLKSEIERILLAGNHAINDINIDGVRALKRLYPAHVFSILLLPPSRERLEARLTKRNPELADEGRARLLSMGDDLDHLEDSAYVFRHIPDLKGACQKDFDAVFVNDDLEVTIYAVLQRLADEQVLRGKGGGA